jgi:hypothetical protein
VDLEFDVLRLGKEVEDLVLEACIPTAIAVEERLVVLGGYSELLR